MFHTTIDKLGSKVSKINTDLKNIKPQLDNFNLSAHTQKLKALHQAYVNKNSDLYNEESFEDIKEHISFEILYSSKNLKDPKLLFPILRDLPVLKGF